MASGRQALEEFLPARSKPAVASVADDVHPDQLVKLGVLGFDGAAERFHLWGRLHRHTDLQIGLKRDVLRILSADALQPELLLKRLFDRFR